MSLQGSNPMGLSEMELQEIERRCQAATAGPWVWERTYQMADGKHWALNNPEMRDGGYGDGLSRTINYALVTLTTEPHALVSNVPLDEEPDFAFIAHARTDVPRLISALREARADSERFDWLEAQFTGADFAYGQFANRSVLIIDLPDGVEVSSILRDIVDRARASLSTDNTRVASTETRE